MLFGSCTGSVAVDPAFGPAVYRNLRPRAFSLSEMMIGAVTPLEIFIKQTNMGQVAAAPSSVPIFYKEVCRRIWKFYFVPSA